jgi:hypothetical protein
MIIRRKHTANFTTIGNVLFNDERLKADEVGIIGYLLSRPHDWEVRRPQLARRFGYGREAIKRVIWNGMRMGWIVAQRTQLGDGRFHVVYEIKDQPGPELSDEDIRRALSLSSSEAAEDQESEGEGVDETGVRGDPIPPGDPPPTGDPATGQPCTAQPATGNPYVVSKEETTKDGFNKDLPTKNEVFGFADVKAVWPATNILSEVSAQSAFLGLSDADKAACHAGIKPYLDDCRVQTRKVCDLTTYVRERRWERFTAKADAARPQVEFIKYGTPQWWRWRDHLLAMRGDIDQFDRMGKNPQYGGKAMPSEWPPSLERKTG